MSVDKVQVNYDQLAQIASRFGSCAGRSDDLRRRVESSLARLEDGGWLGFGADAFFAEMHGELLPAQLRMADAIRLAQTSVREIAELMSIAEEEAARPFRGEANGAADTASQPADGVAAGIPNDKGPPKKMSQLIKLMDSRSQPITIIRNGDGEYLVLLQGTDPTRFGVSNNWISAFGSGNEVTNPFEQQVRDVIAKNIPPGSKIHFVGHSQGGITAHNLVDNADFRSRYMIESVTTIGSSQSAPMRDGIEYHRYANSADAVPWADGGLLHSLSTPKDLPGQLGERLSQTPLDSGTLNPITAHSPETYAKALEASGDNSPSSIDFSQWSNAKEIASVSTDLPTHPGMSGGGWTLLDRTYDAARIIPLAAINQYTESFSAQLPSPVRDAIDQYTDRLSDAVMSIPPPSQIVGSIWNSFFN
ncbi:WXG100 family type VII secretion target [Chloroflexales bacterium ZM16-3]|nr:WXG100 family type VII secretion target [Chloroflexales bacterium ZM16-3]